MKKKLTLEFEEWNYTCGDGCCYDSGVSLKINGEHVTNYADCQQGIIETLEHLGYEVEVI